MVAEAKEVDRPIGEMLSRGEVKFESRENIWKKAEPSHFPVFRDVKIKTEKGSAAIALGNNCQIEVGPNSLFFFDQIDRLNLSQGGINFRISSSAELNFKIGNLLVTKSRSLQASKGPIVASPKNEETIGSITIHSNGSVSIKSTQGQLFILNQDRVVLAALSSQDSVTIPSIAVEGSHPVMVAQAGEAAAGGETGGGAFLGISTWGWIGIIGGAAVVGGIVGVTTSHHGGHHAYLPICP